MTASVPDLVEHAKTHSRECVEGLTDPDEDIMPVLLWWGPHGPGLMPMGDLMKGDVHKDRLAKWITATLAVSQATECVTVTTGYMAKVDRDDPDVDVSRGTVTKPVRERPEAVEAVVLMCSDRRGQGGIVHAELTRYPDKPPTLGDWNDQRLEVGPKVGGRFGDAMNLGLQIAREMPPELVEIIEDGWKIGPEAVQDLIERFVNVATGFNRDLTGPGDMGAG
jgi:hypothetical protein